MCRDVHVAERTGRAVRRSVIQYRTVSQSHAIIAKRARAWSKLVSLRYKIITRLDIRLSLMWDETKTTFNNNEKCVCFFFQFHFGVGGLWHFIFIIVISMCVTDTTCRRFPFSFAFCMWMWIRRVRRCDFWSRKSYLMICVDRATSSGATTTTQNLNTFPINCLRIY